MLPIRKVVLYKHGVGYFERQGEVDGDAAIDLHFRASEMNDVLKSLTTLDLANGRIVSISYESTKPLETQLEDISIRLPESNAVRGLLSEIQGANVAVEIAGERVEGVVSGVETIQHRIDDAIVERPHVALLVDGTALRTFDLLEVTRLEFLDESLQKDLEHLLQVLIDAKKKDRKRLTIYAQGEGRREILAGYIVETPVWKTSYRVLLGGEQPVIQGWALVDNVQDEDWIDVTLSLVAGLPVSFVHDLYSPRRRRRPVVEVEEEEAYAPPILEQAVGGYAMDELATAMEGAPMAAAAPPEALRRERTKSMKRRMVQEQRSEARDRSVQVQTRTAEVGDLFEYAIENPVTVKRNQSALVPILQGPFEGRRVAVYNAEVREKNPMSAVLFHNTTGMTLEGGPLTVLEEEIYVGESMLETLKPDEERLVPYSVELGCVISIDHRSRRQKVRKAVIAEGLLTLLRYRLEETTYEVVNKNDKPIDLFLEHRFRHGWDLVDTPDPLERTDNYYRFRFDVPANGRVLFKVLERGDEERTHGLADTDADTVRLWLSRRYVDAETGRTLADLVALRARVADLERQVDENEERVGEVLADQERQRENLQALGDSQQEKGLRARYVTKLTEGEERLGTLRAEVLGWKQERRRVETDLRARLQAIAFETEIGT